MHTVGAKAESIQKKQLLTTKVPADQAQPQRIDTFLGKQYAHYSRSFFTRLIDDRLVTCNGVLIKKHGVKVKAGDAIVVQLPKEPVAGSEEVKALLSQMNSDIRIIYQHEHFLILNKPVGLMVHRPSSYSTVITLADWLCAKHASIARVGYVDRPGIVHRLDKDTSGLLVVARTNYAHTVFTRLFKIRTMQKTYHALVHGHPPKEGTIDLPIGRHPVHRKKMATFTEKDLVRFGTRAPRVRNALTHYTVLEYFDNAALVKIKPVTGRTHQIRVHFSSIGHPLLGDSVYGEPSPLIDHHALHAAGIAFTFDEKSFTFQADPPSSFVTAHKQLQLK